MSKFTQVIGKLGRLTSAPEMNIEDRKVLRTGLPAISGVVALAAAVTGCNKIAAVAASLGSLASLYFRNRAEEDIDYVATRLREREVRELREAQAKEAAAAAGGLASA